MRYRAFARSLGLFVLVFVLSGCGGGGAGGGGGSDGPPAPGPAPIAQTPAGEPEGLSSFATIGAGGGTLVSSDGRLTISVPPGTLAAATEFGIQPITATAPGALGPGYRLTPEGVTFAPPVVLTFRYSADEAAANALELMRVAERDARGYWVVLPATRDTAARTLSVTATHFSDWSYVGGLQIAPAAATVAVNKQQFLRVVDCGDWPDPNGTNQQRVLLECRTALRADAPSAWSVNGIVNGNASVGTISTIPNLLEFAGYNAPAAVPAQNPVAVSATLDAPAGRLTLVSNIKVVDSIETYVGTFSSRFSGPSGQSQIDANVRFTQLAVAADGTRTYVGGGSARLNGSFTVSGETCAWDAATGDLQPPSSLLVAPNGGGPLANRYQIQVAAQAMSTLRCPGSDTPAPLQVSHSVGLDSGCELPLVGADASVLSGSWSCNLPGGGTLRVNWALKAE